MWKHVDFARSTNALTQIAAAGALALTLAGCNEIAAQHAAPSGPFWSLPSTTKPRPATAPSSVPSGRGSKAIWDFASAEKY
jgi:hypothetical protein